MPITEHDATLHFTSRLKYHTRSYTMIQFISCSIYKNVLFQLCWNMWCPFYDVCIDTLLFLASTNLQLRIESIVIFRAWCNFYENFQVLFLEDMMSLELYWLMQNALQDAVCQVSIISKLVFIVVLVYTISFKQQMLVVKWQCRHVSNMASQIITSNSTVYSTVCRC